MQPKPFSNHTITGTGKETKSRSPFFRSLLGYSVGNSTSTSGDNNTFIGSQAGSNNATGSGNTFSGFKSGSINSSGTGNVFSGQFSGFANNAGNYNTFLGYAAGESNSSGNNNTFLGQAAGINNATGSYNVYISTFGTPDGSQESNTIRIGDPSIQKSAYIAGVYTSMISGAQGVWVNAYGQIGQIASSRRYKEEIRDMGAKTVDLMKLRPVTFLYRRELDPGNRTLQYGLIAEEVADVYPELVEYNSKSEPISVKYHLLTSMLLNELQYQYKRVNAQREQMTVLEQQINEQRAQLNSMRERLDRLEKVLVEPSSIAQTASSASDQNK
jgi:hypothetical protein